MSLRKRKPQRSRRSREQITWEDAHRLFFYERETGLLRSRETGKPVGSLTQRKDRWYLKTDCGVFGTHYNHRLVWLMETGEWPPAIDHRDHDGLNNRIGNLRGCTRQQNAWNRKVPPGHATGCLGVRRRHQRFVAELKVTGIAGTRRQSFPATDLGLALAIECRKRWEAELRIW